MYLCCMWVMECIVDCLLTSVSFRSAAVDSNGREFNRNRLIALMSAIVLEEVRSHELPAMLWIAAYFIPIDLL